MENRHSSFGYEDLLAVRAGELFGTGNAAAAAAPDADVRSHFRDCRGRRRIRQGTGARRARPQAGPLVFSLPFQGRPGDAGLSRARCALAALGFFLGWLGAPGKGRALGLGEVKFSGQVLPTVKNVVYGIDIKRVMRSKLVLGIADGWLSADGSIIYRAMDLKVGLFRDPEMQPSGG